MEVLEHLYSPVKYLKNIYNWLDNPGYLILTTPYHGYFKNLLIVLFNKFDKHFDPLWEGGHIRFFSTKTLHKILRETGFYPIRFYGSGRFPFLWKSIIVVAEKI